MKIFFAFPYIVLLNIFNPANSLIPRPEDGKLNFTGLSVKYGHQVDEHDVVTEDGYILKLFHIPGKRKTPVLLMHGLGDSADCFVIRGKESLAISLADAGYDVWAGNTRGNRYGRRHVKFNPDKDPTFWDFSFHEGGYFDLPAIIDYILQATGEKKLQSIGQSQGTTVHFVLLSKKPEYNEKIKIVIALAPIAFLSDMVPPVSTIAQFSPTIDRVLKSVGLEELFNKKSPITSVLRVICGQDSVISYELCIVAGLFQLTGTDTSRLEPSFLKVLMGHYPESTSRKSVQHFTQLMLNKRFCEFDYGADENLKRYGYMVPTDYNVHKVSAKVALLVGRNDYLSRIKDVEILRTLLPNVVYHHIMEPEAWNHLDFVLSNDMTVTLFPFIFQLLSKYE